MLFSLPQLHFVNIPGLEFEHSGEVLLKPSEMLALFYYFSVCKNYRFIGRTYLWVNAQKATLQSWKSPTNSVNFTNGVAMHDYPTFLVSCAFVLFCFYSCLKNSGVA